jgi:hypothetical protein
MPVTRNKKEKTFIFIKTKVETKSSSFIAKVKKVNRMPDKTKWLSF